MSERRTPVGKIVGVFGVSGDTKVYSYTRPRWNIIEYTPWQLVSREEVLQSVALESVRRHGNGIVAKFTNVDDRAAAAALVGCEITIAQTQFEALPQGEYYWFQLIGLEVVTTGGRALGRVKRLIETGANDVLEVAGEEGVHLIPYVRPDYIKAVDLKAMRIEVDWEADWEV